VLRLPSQKSPLNSQGSESNAEEDEAASNSNKKRKINAIGNGSGLRDCAKVSNFSMILSEKTIFAVETAKFGGFFFGLIWIINFFRRNITLTEFENSLNFAPLWT